MTSTAETTKPWYAPLARLDRVVLPASFIAMIVIFAIANPDRFLSGDNLQAILTQAVVLAILGVGLTVVLASGDFDLSFVYTIGLAGSLGVYMMAFNGHGWVVAVLTAVGVGAAVGAVNGWIVAYLQADAFIVTLAVGTVVAGIEQAITEDRTIYTGISPTYIDLPNMEVLGVVNLYVLVSLLVVVAGWLLMEHTGFGRALHAVGSSRVAASNAGIRVKRKRFTAFLLMGACAGLAGVVITSRSGSAFPGAGNGWLVQPYAAAFLGAALTRRRFHPGATYLGVLYMGTLATGLTMTGQSAWVSSVITGGVLVAAVVLSGQRLSQPPWLKRLLARSGTGDPPPPAAPPPEPEPEPAVSKAR